MIKSIKPTLFAFLLTFSGQVLAIDWNSVNDVDTRGAACLDLKPTSEKEMTDFLEAQISDVDARESRTIRNIHFKDEIPEMLDLFEGIHKPMLTFSQTKDLEKTKCDKVMCTMKQYYGGKSALMMLYIYAKFGVSTSPESGLQPDNYDKWKSHELSNLIIALESLPPTVLPLKDRHLLRFKRGYTRGSYGDDGAYVVANATMEVFDLWDEQSREMKIATIVHELGHVLGKNLDDSTAWTSMPRQAVSEYAKTNSAEDFAESFLAYRFAPRKLGKVSQKRYTYIRDVLFQGLEFKSKRDCEAPFVEFERKVEGKINLRREMVAWTQENKAEIASQVKRQEKMGSFVRLAIQSCGKSYLAEVTDASQREQTSSCIEKLIKKRAASIELNEENREDISAKDIPVSKLSDINVSRSKISIIRQQMRYHFATILDKLYSEILFLPDEEKDCQYTFDTAFLVTSLPEFIKESKTEVKTILISACEKKVREGFFKRMFDPDFSKVLP